MESVIDITVVFRFFMPPGESLGHRFAMELRGKIEHRCCASVERSARTRLKIIGRHCPHRFELEMRMRLDAAGKHVASRAIEGALSFLRFKLSCFRDDPVADPKIAYIRLVGQDDMTVSKQYTRRVVFLINYH